jgi:hypothetical protein
MEGLQLLFRLGRQNSDCQPEQRTELGMYEGSFEAAQEGIL